MLEIQSRLGVSVFVNEGETISIANPDQVDAYGYYSDVIVTIHPDYVDLVIEGLKQCKAEILGLTSTEQKK